MYFEQKQKIAVWTVSGAVGTVIVLMPFLFRLYVPSQPYFIPLSQKVNNIFIFGIMIVIGFPAIVEFINFRWQRQVDKNIPRLLRDVTEAVRSGITLIKALEEASQRDYGPVSKELEHAISLFSLGVSLENALMTFAHRLKRPGALRFSTILVEAHQTGGKLVDVLNESVSIYSSLEEFRDEQYTNMKPYLMTMYLTTIIFLVMSFIILHQFLGPLSKAAVSTSTQSSGLLSGVLDFNYYTSLLFWASVFESVFAGLILGKIVDRTLFAGLRHSVILVFTAFVFFNILVII